MLSWPFLGGIPFFCSFYYYCYYYYYYYIFLCLDPRLNNFMLFLSITQLVRCPCLERDWFSGDQVPIPGRVTAQIFIRSVTVDLRQVLTPSSRPHWHLLFGRNTPSVFLFCVNVFSDNLPSSARRSSVEASRLPGESVVMNLMVRTFAPNHVVVHHCPY